MRYTYEVNPRPPELGGGWRLRLLDRGEEVGGGVFPAGQGTPQEVAEWWNGQNEAEHAWWVEWVQHKHGIDNATPAEVHAIYLRNVAYHEASDEGDDWLDSRPKD